MKKQYVKLVNNVPVFFRNPIVDGYDQIFNPSVEVLNQYGYKEFVRSEPDPEKTDMYDVTMVYEETESEIKQVYQYTFSKSKTQKYFTDMIQSYLDSSANRLGYDSCLSVCSYINSGNPKFDAEGEGFRQWRSAVWAYGYSLLETTTEESQIPSKEDFLAGLPVLKIVYPKEETTTETEQTETTTEG